MKYMVLTSVLWLLSTPSWATHATGNDDSTNPTYNANCNASFLNNCDPSDPNSDAPDDHTHDDGDGLASNPAAAPIGGYGDSAIELLAIILLIAGTWKIAKTRSRPGH